MPAYVALLRGINVSGHKPLKMERLRASFESLGFGGVKTYIQSGNVVFEYAKAAPTSLAQQISTKVLADFGYSVHVLVKTANELGSIIAKNPFRDDKGMDHSKMHVTFLDEPAPKDAAKILADFCADKERIHISNREIYLYCPLGYGDSKLSNNLIEKKLSIQATTRNWNTVNTLFNMTQ